MSSHSQFHLIGALLSSIAARGTRRKETLTLSAWGRERTFVAVDFRGDTFIFEDGIWDRLENKNPVIFVPKADLFPSSSLRGNIFAVSSGNHAVTAMPLLSGKFWDVADIPEAERGDCLRTKIVCGNCLNDTFEISQREVSTERVMQMDRWLQGLGCTLTHIVLVDRADSTLEAYRRMGQEWRIRQLAWTPEEMEHAIHSSESRIHAGLRYFHNVKGVHFLTWPQFSAWGELAATKPDVVRRGLSELAHPSPYDGVSFLRRTRYGLHHEVELFGVPAGFAEEHLLDDIEALARDADALEDAALVARFRAVSEKFRMALEFDELEDPHHPKSQHTLYHHITGEIYHGSPDSVVPAFDDRRTALPGATYHDGARYAHPTADGRTDALLSYVESLVSHGDAIEYVNLYEIRSEFEPVRLGEGKTREVVYKTSWDPLPVRMIEKRLSRKSTGYGSYTMARVEAFRALGISFGPHRLLARPDGEEGETHYYTRDRYPGECFNTLRDTHFQTRSVASGKLDPSGREDPDVIRAVMVAMGQAAAENIILKKYNPDRKGIRYGEGKEIIEFGFDVRRGKEMPLRTWLCSIRGTMGWPDTDCTAANFRAVLGTYLPAFAAIVAPYARAHTAVPLDEITEAFIEGFKAKTRELHWNYTLHKEQFDGYAPAVHADYPFAHRWTFILWSLIQQRKRLEEISEILRNHIATHATTGV
ncbi:MAG: hypothetical protein FWF84_04700 [Kiritimatiellaeota bacterium]|nr:hypothetical protein [Kiritimatiellota bacterium]